MPWPTPGEFPVSPREGRPLDLKRTAAEAPVAADVALADWSALMNAVKCRLERLVTELPINSQPASESKLRLPQSPQSPQSAQQTQLAQLAPLADGVRQCVAALDQLQATVERELARRPRLELEVFDLQTGLSQARAELVGTRAGEQPARHHALHDGLTALPNRGHFLERLDLALGHPLGKQSPLTVFFLDLDSFKQVNDQHGHAVGDDLLRIVAARLARSLRADDMVCRWGGDEFAGLLLGAIEPSSLARMASKLVNAVSAPMQIGALRLSIRSSIGLAMAPADGATAGLLLRHADAAMVRAKRRGIGYAFHELAPATNPGPSGT
ncbi:MAG: GGDEF domain-containing protein [Microbacteriaceae bacterium]|nr:GGDEF domain-containing protein [Burkholderiaceae bacterium]